MPPGRPRKPDSNILPRGYQKLPDDAPDASLYDPSNPYGLCALLDPSLIALVKAIPASYLLMTEAQLKKAVDPDATLCRLRLRFWEEFYDCLPRGSKVAIARVVKGACSRDYFYEVVCRDPKMLAWVFTPPVDHLVSMKETADLGLSEMRDVMLLPNVIVERKYGKNGELVAEVEKADSALLSTKIKILENLLNRVYGAVPQDNRNFHLHAKAEGGSDPQRLEASSIEDLERIESKINRLLGEAAGAPVPVIEGEAE